MTVSGKLYILFNNIEIFFQVKPKISIDKIALIVYNYYNTYATYKGDNMVKWYSEDIWTDNKDNDFGLIICIQYDNDLNMRDWRIYIAKVIYKNEMHFKLVELSDSFDPSDKRQLYEFDCCNEVPISRITWNRHLDNTIIFEGGVLSGKKEITSAPVSA